MEPKELVDQIKSQFEQFKVQNDQRLAEIAKHGEASAETSAKVDRLNDSLSAVSDRIEALENRANRPLMPGRTAPEDEQVRVFKDWLHKGIQNAAMQEGTTTEGGYTVPTPMSNDIVMGLQAESIFRSAGARVVPMTNWKMDVPTLTKSTRAIQTAEEGAVSEVEPTVGTVQAVAYKFTKLVKASKELVADSKFDLWGQILAPDFAHAFALAENADFTTGDGSGHPQGITVGGTSAATTASATAVTADEIMDCFYSLDYRLQGNAKWMMANATVKAIRKLKDGDGQYLWAPGFAGEPATILGRPLIKNDDMPAMTAGLKPIIVGDFSYFWIFDRQEMSLQRLVELYAGNGQIGFLADKRFDSHVMLATAFYFLTMHA